VTGVVELPLGHGGTHPGNTAAGAWLLPILVATLPMALYLAGVGRLHRSG